MDNEKHSYKVDLETFIGEEKRPIHDLVSGSLIPFSLLDMIQKKIDYLSNRANSLQQIEVIKSYQLDTTILGSISALIQQRAELAKTLFDAILSGYKDPLTNSGISSFDI